MKAIRLAIAVATASLLFSALPVSAQASTGNSTAVQARVGCSAAHGRRFCNGYSVRRIYTWGCVYITKADLEAAGWGEIVNGVTITGSGLLADGTVIGLPAGALLNLTGLVVGLGGSFVVWYADTYFSPGWYCGWVSGYAR